MTGQSDPDLTPLAIAAVHVLQEFDRSIRRCPNVNRRYARKRRDFTDCSSPEFMAFRMASSVTWAPGQHV